MSDGNLLSDKAIQNLKREIFDTVRHQFTDLRRELQGVIMRRHQAVYMPAKTKAVEWRNPGLKDTALGQNFSPGDNATLYFTNRIGPADIGITHDPSVSSPLADGNFTCTSAGRYLVSMWWMVAPRNNWTHAASDVWENQEEARLTFWVKEEGGSFEQIQHGQCWCAQVHGSEFNASHTASTMFTVNLNKNDKIRLLAIAQASNVNTNEWNLAKGNITFVKLGSKEEEIDLV